MVVGPAVAEAEFEYDAIEPADQLRGMVETGALRFEPADETVEPAHADTRRTAGPRPACRRDAGDPVNSRLTRQPYWAAVAPAPSRSRRTSDKAVRSWLL